MVSKKPPLQIYGMDEETEQRIKQGAKKNGLSESAFCRMIIRRALRDNPYLWEAWEEVKIPADVVTED